VARLKRFAADNSIPFDLGSDSSGKVRRLYDVRRRFGLGTSRFTYVIDSQGIIRDVYHNELSMSSHARRALRVVEDLEQPGPITLA
jgi:peroxiredoxin Q/BCP